MPLTQPPQACRTRLRFEDELPQRLIKRLAGSQRLGEKFSHGRHEFFLEEVWRLGVAQRRASAKWGEQRFDDRCCLKKPLRPPKRLAVGNVPYFILHFALITLHSLHMPDSIGVWYLVRLVHGSCDHAMISSMT